jgi:hypothetical protein
MITWYTTAWFDKYVKGDATADRRLTTGRWRSDAEEGAVDPTGDPNMFSFYYPSRLDIGLAGGGRFVCEDMRPGCPGVTSDDGEPAKYSYLDIVTSPDRAGTAAGATGINGCSRSPSRVVRIRSGHGRIVRADVYINGKRVATTKGRRLTRVEIPPAGGGRYVAKVVLRAGDGRRFTSVRTYNGCTKTKPRRVRT